MGLGWQCSSRDSLFSNSATPWLAGVKVTPETLAKKIAVPARVTQGRQLASEGKIEETIAEFKQALEWDPTLELDPKAKAGEIYAGVLDRAGEELAQRKVRFPLL